MEGIQVCSNEEPRPFPRGDNSKNVKLYWKYFKIFSRTIGPISTKLGTMNPWMEGIQVCSNAGPHPFPRGDNYEIAKIHWNNLKIFFPRTTEPISYKLGTIHPWVSLGEGDLNLFKRRAPPFSKGRTNPWITCPTLGTNSLNVLEFFSPTELKAQVSFSNQNLSVVVVVVVGVNFSHFHLLPQNHWANFN